MIEQYFTYRKARWLEKTGQVFTPFTVAEPRSEVCDAVGLAVFCLGCAASMVKVRLFY